jgi:hypothetical protein
MKEYIRIHLKQIIASIIIILLIGLSFYLYYSYSKKLNTSKKDYEALNQKYLKAEEDLKLKDTQIEEKNKEIEDLKKASNKSIRSDVESSSGTANSGSSIFDRINGSADFKNKIINALNALQAGDGEHYAIVASQVETINENDNYGGKQERRNIYIGADSNAAITASIISHEAMHVYNVYVNRIWSYGTKEQELPCYEAELATAQRLGAPAFFIASVQDSVNYWQSQ